VTGMKVWDANVLGSSNREVTWGVSGSPLVVEDLGVVIVAVGGRQGPSLAAYDLIKGTQSWTGGEAGGGYSTPTLATLAGRRQVVLFDSAGLAGFDVNGGKELWRHGWRTFQDMNIIQPIVLSGDRVFVSSEASNGSAMLQISKTEDGFAATVLWETKDLASKFSNPVALGGAIYGLSIGTLVCLDERTGERLWKGRRYGHGQILAAGGSLIVLSERGSVALVKADSKAFKQLASLNVFKDKTWNTPALAGRRLFIRNAAEMACLELPRR
jgi:outer membrane protein assembly factor BamB